MHSEPITKRCVFYIPGFDPRGARHYHELYKTNVARQSAVNGLFVNVGPRIRLNDYVHRWTIDTKETHTVFDCLSWDDIVRREWRAGLSGWLCDIYSFYSWRVMRDLGPAIIRGSVKRFAGGFYPLIYFTLSVLGCIFLFKGIGAAGGWAWPWVACGLAAAALLWIGSVKLAQKIAVFWLLKIYGFTARWGENCSPCVAARIDLFAAHIAKELENTDAQEILLVGHSVGGILSIPVMARLLETQALTDKNAGRFVLVTLGQSIPLVSFQRKAETYRRDLTRVTEDRRVLWVDYSAPADGACFPAMSVSPEPLPAEPIKLSTRFVRLYEKKKYKRMRFNPYKIHFLYLMSSDYVGAYDYFAMTAGAQSLYRRLEGQVEAL